MKKVFLFVFFLAFFLTTASLFSKSVLADGMMIAPDPYFERWDYSNETEQKAFINYDKGMQKMIISVGFEEENSSGLVWLFPVPADPSKTVIDVVKSFPELDGEEISGKAKTELNKTREFLLMTQVYSIPFVRLYGAIFGTKLSGINNLGDTGMMGAKSLGEEAIVDVEVYEHLEKEGIISEVITAKTSGGLYAYLKNKGLKIETDSIPVLDNYIGKDFSFVVSWISTVENDLDVYNKTKNRKGVFVAFPTDDIYFPLLPTSVYGSKIVPATIRVIGHVSPKIFEYIKSYTKVDYYVDDYAYFFGLENFYDGQKENMKYTKIEIKAPSKFLTDDLWIKKQAPIKTYFSTFMSRHIVTGGMFLLMLSSVITGILAGMMFFKDLRKNPVRLALIGLSNFFTIFGLLAIIGFVRTKDEDSIAEPLLAEIKRRGYFWKRKLAVILYFVATFYLMFGYCFYFWIIGETDSLLNLPIIYGPPLLFLIAGLTLIKVKIEDKNLFEQLKLEGYSSWSFHPKDKNKYVFVPVFSILFLIISWFLIDLVKLIV